MAEKEVDDLLTQIRVLNFQGDRKDEFLEDLKDILTKIVIMQSTSETKKEVEGKLH